MTAAPDARPASGPDQDAAPSETERGAASARPASARGIAVLRRRREFLACANRGRRQGLPGLMLQARRRDPAERAESPLRVGYTCSKKVGNAVARNRAKRRLRAAAAEVLPRLGRPGWDYVLIGRREATAERPFPELKADLESGLARLHGREDAGEAERPAPPRRRKGKGGTKGGGGAPKGGGG